MTHAYISRRHRRWDRHGRLGWVVDTKQGISTIAYVDLQGNHYIHKADTASDGVAFPYHGKVEDVPVQQTLADYFGDKPPAASPLVGDIRKNGLRWPLVIGERGGLIGRHRLLAVAALGWQTVPAYVVPLEAKDFRQM